MAIRVGMAVIPGVVALAVVALGGSYKGFPDGYDRSYAAREFDKLAPKPKLNWTGNASAWVANADAKGWKTSKMMRGAKVGALIVWRGGQGHVGVVTGLTADGLVVGEMNVGKVMNMTTGLTDNFGKVTKASLRFGGLSRGGGLEFEGYIYPERK